MGLCEMNVKERMTEKLRLAFAPVLLDVVDDSHQHAGHAGWRESGETHFSVRIVSAAFVGMNRVERHRAVNAALAEELAGGVHALAIEVKAEEEQGAGFSAAPRSSRAPRSL